MENEPLSRVLECALLATHVLLENGAETYRAEESATRICSRFGVDDPQVLALPTGAVITLMRAGEMPATALRRVRKRTTNLGRIDAANQISRSVEQGEMALEDAVLALTELSGPKSYPAWKSLLAAAASSAFFALLFGGSWFDFIAAALCGGSVQALSSSFRREDYFHFIISLAGGTIIALFAVVATTLFPFANQDAIIAGALMPLLPGLAMTNAIRDTMRGDLVSGVSRAAEALLVAVSLAAGVGVVLGARVLVAGWFA